MSTFRLFITFYGYFFLSAILLTIACLVTFWNYGLETIGPIFQFKVCSLGVTVWFIATYKKKEFFYFRNLGLSPGLLWTVTLVFDFILFGSLVIFTYFIKWRTH